MSDIGCDAVVEALKSICQTHLQTYLDAIEVAAGTSYGFVAPSSTRGYSTEQTYVPPQRANAIQIFVPRVDPVEHTVNKDGPIKDSVEVEVKWHKHSKLPEMGQSKRLRAHALKKCLTEHWHSYADTPSMFGLWASIDLTAGLRETSQTPGRGGRQALTGDNIDTLIVRVRVMQRVSNTIQ